MSFYTALTGLNGSQADISAEISACDPLSPVRAV